MPDPERVALSIICPTCGAAVGEPCWSSGLRFGRRTPHRGRLWATKEPDRILSPELHRNWLAVHRDG